MEIYPSFSYYKRDGKKYSKLSGDIDICDTTGIYLDSFNIEIWLNKERYPYSTPLVKEHSTKIQRHEDWHIDEDGYVCLDIEHELEYKAKKGIQLVGFYQDHIYPFFANTLYKMSFGKYANGEYGHFFEGVVQFYKEKLQLADGPIIITILNAILDNTVPGRNARPCICGEDKKFKRCHLQSVEFLQSLSRERLLKDLAGFEEISGIVKTKSKDLARSIFP
ncbi:hypothetical protein [Flagellimonas sp.]|uniref:ubiquitin-conjugating enzyme E2 variant n=1 Tax=Flagellimonas sp. TaxID=2058762 RepID=UPI003BB05C89